MAKVVLLEALNRKLKSDQIAKRLVIQNYLDRHPKLQQTQQALMNKMERAMPQQDKAWLEKNASNQRSEIKNAPNTKLRNYLDRHSKRQQSKHPLVQQYINQRRQSAYIHHGDAAKEQKEEIDLSLKQSSFIKSYLDRDHKY